MDMNGIRKMSWSQFGYGRRNFNYKSLFSNLIKVNLNILILHNYKIINFTNTINFIN